MTDYKFSYDAMLDLNGNTAVYLQGIERKFADKTTTETEESERSERAPDLSHPKERALAMHLARCPEALEDCLHDMAPNRLAEYLYELAERFNSFYVNCKVLDDEKEAGRMVLVRATGRVMRDLLGLLGITPIYGI